MSRKEGAEAAERYLSANLQTETSLHLKMTQLKNGEEEEGA